jgi:DNA-binding CsgD family transcriptional regulator/predicted ATPase
VGTLLHAQSEGNPFFAEELLLGWVEMGVLAMVGGRWSVVAPPQESLPPSIAAAVRQRVSRLSPRLVDYLRTASIIGRTFASAFLARVAGEDVEAVEECLVEGVQAGLVRQTQGGTYAFSHDKIRECLYGDVSSTRRTRLHEFIGEALEAEREDEGALDSHRLADLAFHFARSGHRQKGVLYSRRAAEQALRAYAAEEAMAHYRTALTLDDVRDAEHGDLLMGLGEASMLAGADRDAVGAFRSALAWYHQRGEKVRAALAAHGLGRARWRLEELLPARAAFEEARNLLEDAPRAETARVLIDLGSLLVVSLHEQREGIACGERALALARSLGDGRLEAGASRVLGNLLVRGGQLAEGVPLLEKALEIALQVDDLAEAAECCAFLAPAYMWLGDLRRSHQITLRRLEYGTRCNDPYLLRHVYSWLATIHLARAEYAEAEEMLSRGQALVEHLASPEPMAFLDFSRALWHHEWCQFEQAEEAFERAMAAFRAVGPGALVWYLTPYVLTKRALGKHEEAAALMLEAEELLNRQPAGAIARLNGFCTLALAALQAGDTEGARRFAPELLRFRGLHDYFLADRVLSEVAIAEGDLSAAGAYLDAAEAQARRDGLLIEVARCLVTRAKLESARGVKQGAARARELVEQALEVSRRHNLRLVAREAEDVLRDLPGGHHRAQERPPLPGGLSTREAEVLRLVVEGKSNRQIADALALSEKTVANHLTNIYIKTGTDNRAAATAFAVRHGLG